MAHAAIAATHLSKSYGRRLGIEDVSFEVTEGEAFGFLGPNGAGKTTTIRLLMGLLRPTSGRRHIRGRDTFRKRPPSTTTSPISAPTRASSAS